MIPDLDVYLGLAAFLGAVSFFIGVMEAWCEGFTTLDGKKAMAWGAAGLFLAIIWPLTAVLLAVAIVCGIVFGFFWGFAQLFKIYVKKEYQA